MVLIFTYSFLISLMEFLYIFSMLINTFKLRTIYILPNIRLYILVEMNRVELACIHDIMSRCLNDIFKLKFYIG